MALTGAELANAMLIGVLDGMQDAPADPPVHGRDYAFAYNRGHTVGLKADVEGENAKGELAKVKLLVQLSYHRPS